ncbi:hypothetical protein CR513_08736, partial [Mucuna pruriens]
MENQLAKLTSLVRQLVVGQQQPPMTAKIYGICTSVEHPTDMCPTLQETESGQSENVGAIGGFQYVWKATNLARAESRAICSSAIRTCLECTSRSSRLPTAKFTLPSTTIPAAATATKSVSTR